MAALYFRLEMYKVPAMDDPNRLVETVRFTPIDLENEKDEAFLRGLNTLREPFTFIKDDGFDRQMWEFCTEVNNCMVAWQNEEEEEEEEDDEVEVVGDN